jgi:hypothetical protein
LESITFLGSSIVNFALSPGEPITTIIVDLSLSATRPRSLPPVMLYLIGNVFPLTTRLDLFVVVVVVAFVVHLLIEKILYMIQGEGEEEKTLLMVLQQAEPSSYCYLLLSFLVH